MITPRAGRRWTAYALSVPGASHSRKSLPCQDASAAGVLQGDGWAYAIVADGHGSRRHFRSETGARFAVDALRDAFEAISGPSPGGLAAHGVTSSIWSEWAAAQVTARWRSRVWADLLANPPDVGDDTIGEPALERFLEHARQRYGWRDAARLADQIRNFREFAMASESVPEDEPLPLPSDDSWDEEAFGTWHAAAYGTTLLGVLVGPDSIYCFRQGDGAMVVVRDGAAAYLVEPPAAAIANETPSMCDDDAVLQIETPALPLSADEFPAAVILTTDGIPNSFVETGGFWQFCSELAAMGNEPDLPSKLERWLPELSSRGSGDDVSIAILVPEPEKVTPIRGSSGKVRSRTTKFRHR